MTSMLKDILLEQDTEPKVISDCQVLIESQLAEKSGVTGKAVNLAYKALKAVKPGYLEHIMASLLPQFVDKLEPYWADFNASGGSDFGDYLAKHGDEVSSALLSVTDARAAASQRVTLIKAYGTVRGGAVKHIQAALPQLGDLVRKYAG